MAVDPLAMPCEPLYPWHMSVRSRSPRGPLCWIVLAVVAATAVGTTWGVLSMHSVMTEGFLDRGLAYAQAFSTSTLPWVDPPNLEMLDAASRFMLVGSALYVQIVIEGATVSDERTVAFLDLSLDPLAVPDTASVERRNLNGSPAHLDVVVPLPSTGQPASYVRIGIDEASLSTRKRNTTLAGVGIGLSIDVLLVGLFWWLLRRRHDGAPNEDGDTAPARRPVHHVGNLTVDPSRRQVELAGRPVRLTPKQFALLEVLASEPRRVFSDREIVERVWAESPYADSKDVKQYVYLLRKRLSAACPNGEGMIETVPGFGYRLNPSAVDRTLTDD